MTSMAPTATERLDPRCIRSRERVLAAAVAVLREEGLSGLTFEAVATRSGVARTTIYRQFPDRAALHLAAIESVGPDVRMPLTDDLVADVTRFCDRLNHTLVATDFGGVILTALDGAERDEQMRELAKGVADRRRGILVDRLRAEQVAGRFAADVDLDLVCSQLVGPLFYRRFMSRQPTGHDVVSKLVSGVLTPLLRS